MKAHKRLMRIIYVLILFSGILIHPYFLIEFDWLTSPLFFASYIGFIYFIYKIESKFARSIDSTTKSEDLTKQVSRVSKSTKVTSTVRKKENETQFNDNVNTEVINEMDDIVDLDTQKPESQTEEQTKVNYIGYEPSDFFFQADSLSYPIVVMPKQNCVIKFPKKGRTGRKGYKEEDFKAYIINYFSNTFKIYDDRVITLKNSAKPYEPDMTLIDENNGINIFLDVEIDEPYEGLNDISKRSATHFIGIDQNRDNAFKNRGWITIRFAEIQVHQNPESCCLFIAEVINSIYPEFLFPQELLEYEDIEPVQQWSKILAIKWSKEKYRESYLGIDSFGFKPESELMDDISENELDFEIEEEVQDDQFDFKQSSIKESPKISLINSTISRSKYLTFQYNNDRTVVNPKRIIKNTLFAYCYVKNREREFNVLSIQEIRSIDQFYTRKETGPNIGVDRIRDIVNEVIQNDKFLRMIYTRGAWSDMMVDTETGELVLSRTEEETSTRTISRVNFALDILEEEQIDQYNLRNEDYQYISAYCHKREDQRTFRFDRISQIEILNI